MRKTEASPASPLPKRVSPEVAEVLHMLKSLETQAPATAPAPQTVVR